MEVARPTCSNVNPGRFDGPFEIHIDGREQYLIYLEESSMDVDIDTNGQVEISVRRYEGENIADVVWFKYSAK